jgi:hypothetical protein
MAIEHYKGNRSPSLSDTITVDGVAFDLTGSSVKFKMRPENSSTLKVDAAAIVTSTTNGTVRYDWAANDVDTAGEYVGWWEVTLPSAKTQDSPEFGIVMRDHALPSGDLCSVEDVREALEISFSDRTRDDLIATYISAASRAIMREYEREFAPASTGVTRTFSWRGSGVVNLAPYDLRSATQISVNPESTSPTTLTITTEYTLLPVPVRDGVYTSLLVSPYVIPSFDFLSRYGWAQVSVTGDWGFASVPKDVRQAAVLTVTSWLRRDVSQLVPDIDPTVPDLQPDQPANFSIPPAARRLLASYRRQLAY